MRGSLLAALVVLTVLATACGPKAAPVPVAGPLHYPDFIEPTVGGTAAGSPLADQTKRAWTYLQSGDLRSASREAGIALKAQPAFYPALTVQAYISLARKEGKNAVQQFATIADAHPDYAPALAGKGLALVAIDQNAEAADAFRAAVKVDPSLTDLARRVDVLTLRGLQDELTAARQAARGGQLDAAARAYHNAIAASPDSAFLYKELAGVERQQDQLPAAVEHLRKAIDLDPSDPASRSLLGDALEQQGDLEGALTAYAGSLAIESDPDVEAKQTAVRGRLELAALPEQYRAIETNPQTTRADLAALIAIRLPALVQAAPVRDVSVLTDIRGNWAERYIGPVARTGLVEAYANHTFQPRAVVRRVDLAQAVSRLLAVVAAQQPGRPQSWMNARERFTDIGTGHLAYTAASTAVAAGVMHAAAGGAFQPTQIVTGADASAAIERVRTLATPVATAAGRR